MDIIIQYLCCLKIIIPVAGNYVLCLLDSLQFTLTYHLKMSVYKSVYNNVLGNRETPQVFETHLAQVSVGHITMFVQVIL